MLESISTRLGRIRGSTDGLSRRVRGTVDRRLVVVLGAILAIALVFRLRNLGAAPFWIDEAHSSWAARNFLEGRGFSNPAGPSSPYRRGWLTTSLPIAGSFWLFGFSEFAARLPMVVYGLLTVLVAYLLGAHYDRLLGFMLAAFVAVDPFLVVWSRTARMYAPLTFFFLATVYVTLRWYAVRDLDPLSPYPVALGVLVVLGFTTHRAYLAVGAVVTLFLAVQFFTRLHHLEEYAVDAMDPKTRRAGLLCFAGVVVAVGFVALNGVPSILTATPPENWPERGPGYYLTVLGFAYPFLRVLAVPGAVYAWFRYEDSRLLVIALVLPFLVASITPRKAPRFIVHLAPLVGFFSFLLIADGLRLAWSRVTADTEEVRTTDVAMAATGPILILLVLAAPVAGFAVADSPYDPPHQPTRSDWEKAGEWLATEADDDAVIMSTRPELSLWYYGETDYFFQRGRGAPTNEAGKDVHPRTGTVFMNDPASLDRLLDGDRDVWLLAGKKFHMGFTDPEMRLRVEEGFERRGDPSWVRMEIYHYDADRNATG